MKSASLGMAPCTVRLQPGDHIVRIDGAAVGALKPFYDALWSGEGAEREVTLEVRRATEVQTVKLRSLDRMKTLRQAQGV